MAHWYNGTKSKMYVTFMWMEKISLQIFIVDKMSGLLYPGYISLCVLQIGFFVIGKCQLLQFPRIIFIIQIFSLIQYAALRMGHQFLPFFYVKSSSNLKPNDSFGICSSWGFRNTPYMLNLMKFWLRYLRLKTIDTTSKFNFISTFIASSEMEPCL